ncbi:hypothetical protein M422DRAFT_262000 [Sphaerobolus stellatus SS14]|uniref:acylphosphatase n=1 Tax=Sphaerobolus stellatus (strain SS14) TaxID=990650 RepID=A0A0C9V2E1_SPHS4|nr:hypothetical protein M422DRAFT_262000 [Sphaerobolus stellatus SS14]
MPSSFQFTVSGLVQGVSYRAFAKKIAESHGIKGYVKNDPLGTVSGVAQGDSDALAKFKDALAQGPWLAEVKDLKVTNETEIGQPEYSGFDID